MPWINPLVSSILSVYRTFGQNIDFNYRRDPQKISFERRNYESIDGKSMASLSYGRIFCLEFQKIDGTYQRYNHYFEFFLLEFYFFLLKI